jgi:hypothetical protein
MYAYASNPDHQVFGRPCITTTHDFPLTKEEEEEVNEPQGEDPKQRKKKKTKDRDSKTTSCEQYQVIVSVQKSVCCSATATAPSFLTSCPFTNPTQLGCTDHETTKSVTLKTQPWYKMDLVSFFSLSLVLRSCVQ